MHEQRTQARDKSRHCNRRTFDNISQDLTNGQRNSDGLPLVRPLIECCDVVHRARVDVLSSGDSGELQTARLSRRGKNCQTSVQNDKIELSEVELLLW